MALRYLWTDSCVSRFLAATVFRPGGARRAFPCFDEPHLRAPFRISVFRDRFHIGTDDVGFYMGTGLVSLIRMRSIAIYNYETINEKSTRKKEGGIRPIAVGNTFRRFTAKLASASVRSERASKFAPRQVGFGTKGGSEAAAHATRTFVKRNRTRNAVVLKIDFRIAFNEFDRDTFLEEMRTNCLSIYPFLWQCYATSTLLFYGEDTIDELDTKIVDSVKGLLETKCRCTQTTESKFSKDTLDLIAIRLEMVKSGKRYTENILCVDEPNGYVSKYSYT